MRSPALTPGVGYVLPVGPWSAWLEVHSQRGAERARLVRQVSDAGPGSAFLVECQERALVREVVSVQREVPLFLLDADPRVHDIVCRLLLEKKKKSNSSNLSPNLDAGP